MSELTEYLPLIWLGIFIFLFVIEALTTQIISVWYAISALLTAIISFFITSLAIQIIIFAVVGTILVFFTRPIVTKILKNSNKRSDLIEKEVQIVDVLDNEQKLYEAKVEGKIFRAKATHRLEIGDFATIEKIEGNILYLKK